MTVLAFLAPQYEGRLERVENNKVVGWAWDRNHPDIPVIVEIYVDNVCTCVVMANESRGDLRRAEKSDGTCAFSALLPPSVCDGAQHVIRAVVAYTDGKELIGTLRAEVPSLIPTTTSSAHCGGNGKKNVFYPTTPANSLKVSEQRVKAMVGKDDWLFLSHDSNRLHDQLHGVVQLSEAQLDTYRRVFAQRIEAFGKIGIPYVFATAPTKELLYEERLPSGFVVDRERFPASQIRSVLARDGIDVLCLESALRNARTHEDVYYRTDTHWNDAGNYTACVELLKRCQLHLPELQIESREELISSCPRNGYRGDLAHKPKVAFVGGRRSLVHCNDSDFNSQDFTEYPVNYRSDSESAIRDGIVEDYLNVSPTRPSVVKINANENLPRILVFHDSFMTGVIKFMSLSFSRSVFVWRPEVLFDVVRKEKPDIVLHMMADRFMVREPRNMGL